MGNLRAPTLIGTPRSERGRDPTPSVVTNGTNTEDRGISNNAPTPRVLKYSQDPKGEHETGSAGSVTASDNQLQTEESNETLATLTEPRCGPQDVLSTMRTEFLASQEALIRINARLDRIDESNANSNKRVEESQARVEISQKEVNKRIGEFNNMIKDAGSATERAKEVDGSTQLVLKGIGDITNKVANLTETLRLAYDKLSQLSTEQTRTLETHVAQTHVALLTGIEVSIQEVLKSFFQDYLNQEEGSETSEEQKAGPIEETGPEEIPTPARTVPMPSESTTRHEVLGSGELLTTILPATERVTEPVARKGGTPSTVAQAGTTHQGLVITPTMYNLNSTTMGKSDPPSGTAKLARQIEGINDKWISTVPSPARTGAAGNLQFQDQDDGGSRDWIDAIDHSQQETHLGSSEPDSPSSDDDCDNKRMPPVENQEISQTLCNKCKEPQTPRYTFVNCSGCKRAFHSACLSFSSYSMCDSCVQAGKSSPERTDDSSTTTDESEKEYKSNNRANRRESPPTRSTTRHSPTNNSKAGIADPAKPPTSEIDNSDIRSQIESQSSTTTSTSQRVSSEPKAKSQASLVNFGFSQN